MKVSTKSEHRTRRHVRIRMRVNGTTARPRLVVYRSIKYTYAQLIDDTTHKTLTQADDRTAKTGTKTERAKEVGKKIAELAKTKKVNTCVFDRNGYKYHGRVRAVAEGAREAGLAF